MKPALLSWLTSFGIGLLTAITAGAVAGWIAWQAVIWHSISDREGNAGYFVVFMVLLGALGGLVVGTTASRVLVGRSEGFLAQLLAAQGVALGILIIVGLVTRLSALAGEAPTYQGEKYLLAVEISWPQAMAPDLSTPATTPSIAFASIEGNTYDDGLKGPLWVQDARRVNGRVVVPGTVAVWTGTGKRLLVVNTGRSGEHTNFQLPLPARPGAEQRAWSEWLPRAPEGSAPLPDGIRYRFRVVKTSEAVRTTTIGPFTVDTRIRALRTATYGDRGEVLEADAHYAIRLRGEPLAMPVTAGGASGPSPAVEEIREVAVVPGKTPALVVRVLQRNANQTVDDFCHLVQAGSGTARITPMGPCRQLAPVPIAIDVPEAPVPLPPGSLDDRSLREPGLYLFDSAILDTRSGEVRPFAIPANEQSSNARRPLAVSPDGRTVAILWVSGRQTFIDELVMTSGARRQLPADSAVVPTGEPLMADAEWFTHWFAWKEDGTGAFHVVPRPGATPMAPRVLRRIGEGFRHLELRMVRRAFLDAVVAELERGLGARREKKETEPGAWLVQIDSVTLEASFHQDYFSEHGDIHLAQLGDSVDRATLARVADFLDQRLATRRLDRFFARLAATTP